MSSKQGQLHTLSTPNLVLPCHNQKEREKHGRHLTRSFAFAIHLLAMVAYIPMFLKLFFLTSESRSVESIDVLDESGPPIEDDGWNIRIEKPCDYGEKTYLSFYPDVAKAVKQGAYSSGFEHWKEHGKREQRKYTCIQEVTEVIVPQSKAKVEAILDYLPDGMVLVDKQANEYYTRYAPKSQPSYIQVFDNYLPSKSLHQEGASCRVGTKLYMIGGSNGTLHDIGDVETMNTSAWGGRVVTIYDMKDMATKYGPEFPYNANHNACAEGPDGTTLHVTGGFLQTSKEMDGAAHMLHYALDTTDENAVWTRKSDMPFRRGAHGCSFLKDGKMYCVGGAVSQWGPFSSDLMIYDPAKDSWEIGPSMITPRDHIYETATAIKDKSQLYVAGGRTHIRHMSAKDSNPKLFSNTNAVEIFDLDKNQWKRRRDLLAVRAAVGVVPYHRNGPQTSPTLLLVGGELFHGLSGEAHRIVDEYDIENDLYYCLKPLSWPYYGGALGVYDGEYFG